MAVGKEIREKIKSVKSTQKITRAMEMVAASKMRKAQERMEASRPYSDKIAAVVGHLANAHPEYQHSYLNEREEKRVGYIVISSDRGLCGGLNVNLFREAIKAVKAHSDAEVDIDYTAIGSKALGFLGRMGGNVVSEASQLGDNPEMAALIGTVKAMLDAYDEGRIDRLYVVYNKFVNTMTQEPTVRQVLPLEQEKSEDFGHHWDYIYEPDAKPVMDTLLQRYVESIVYQGVVENVACEMSARMVAMKSATDNAGDLINDLELVYNKARQTAITSELADIVGGAAAV
ncbi:MAG: F0F1 ATP synthase subunit gamma [Gammaproteobacteria bacterium]|jgi:F-type H+-transporting ATPase subunit gamma|nr:F0F1 ATP synthase subunit gamma [Gammaproteobacteria bacterium]MBT4607825.1 F0F1 ATP synthase subunit gamma [Thiotrichales bacterium]MBT3471842.1 F0F1 ATP synthase subunit gamma [Gammaproteobacteria bacterium]MBT3966995.1 F0F1 ATP synthase subunit gamma [Gammaproteobacteria bacterium]MBT4081405.1 F0F1 ATP synthase subunit gamma [Gammaproteobacteria bacterium]